MSGIRNRWLFLFLLIVSVIMCSAAEFPAQAYMHDDVVVYGPRPNSSWNGGDYYPPHREYYAAQRGYYPPPPPVVLYPPPILPGVSIILPFGIR